MSLKVPTNYIVKLIQINVFMTSCLSVYCNWNDKLNCHKLTDSIYVYNERIKCILRIQWINSIHFSNFAWIKYIIFLTTVKSELEEGEIPVLEEGEIPALSEEAVALEDAIAAIKEETIEEG